MSPQHSSWNPRNSHEHALLRQRPMSKPSMRSRSTPRQQKQISMLCRIHVGGFSGSVVRLTFKALPILLQAACEAPAIRR